MTLERQPKTAGFRPKSWNNTFIDQLSSVDRAPSGIANPALINGCSFIRWELFAINIGCHSHYGFTNTHIIMRVLYFILVVSTVHSTVKRKVTVFLQHFCHNVLHSSCCGGHHSLLPLFSTKELVNFLLFYFIFALTVCNHGAATHLTARISGLLYKLMLY